MTSFDPSKTDYGYPLYTYGQYYGGYSSANASKSVCCGLGTTVGLVLQGQPRDNPSTMLQHTLSCLLHQALDFAEVNCRLITASSIINSSSAVSFLGGLRKYNKSHPYHALQSAERHAILSKDPRTTKIRSHRM